MPIYRVDYDALKRTAVKLGENEKARAMTYEDLEQAMEDGKQVQVCSVNQKGQAIEWFDIDTPKWIYDVSRYRIVNSGDND